MRPALGPPHRDPEPEPSQGGGRPAILVGLRGLGDDQPTPDREESGPDLGRQRRRAEAAGGHQHGLLALIRAMGQRLGPSFDDLDAAIGSEELRRGGREIGRPTVPGFHERHPGVGPTRREHQAGEPTAAAEIHDAVGDAGQRAGRGRGEAAA